MAATQYAARWNRAFTRLWKMHGQPTIDIIDPVANWSLSAGVSYDAHHDQFLNGAGAVVAVSWSTQPKTTANCLPTRRDNTVTLSPLGMLSQDAVGRNITLKWTADVQADIVACWGVALGDTLYRVKSWEVYPEGVDAPIELRLSLVKA